MDGWIDGWTSPGHRPNTQGLESIGSIPSFLASSLIIFISKFVALLVINSGDKLLKSCLKKRVSGLLGDKVSNCIAT